MFLSLHTIIAAAILTLGLAQVSLYKPCPLLGPFFPRPLLNASSPTLQSSLADFTKYLDQYITEGDGDFGPITPNVTSFSLALFAGSSDVNGDIAPVLYEYNHGAQGAAPPRSDSLYAIGDISQVFTVLALLAELGSKAWEDSIVEYLPELNKLAGQYSTIDPLQTVKWQEVTLGALSGHMAGIARDSNACQVAGFCEMNAFLSSVKNQYPVYLPDTAPIYSQEAFQLLAFAISQHSNQPFSQVLADRITTRLGMNSTAFLHSKGTLYGSAPFPNISGSPAALGLASTTSDLCVLGRSILTSSILPSSTTRKWLKPFTSTSNLANSVGRPWEIYHFKSSDTGTIIDTYAKIGNVGNYGSYFGFVPDYDVGFVILAVNEEGNGTPDMNAYGDMSLVVLQSVLALSHAEAKAGLAGRYGNGMSNLVLNVTDEGPGLVVDRLDVNGTDWLAEIAKKSKIEPEYLDFRLYPTNLVRATSSGKEQAFRGVIQDKSGIVDAGTPTCISWMTIGEIERDGLSLDNFVFELADSGEANTVRSPALGIRFERQL